MPWNISVRLAHDAGAGDIVSTIDLTHEEKMEIRDIIKRMILREITYTPLKAVKHFRDLTGCSLLAAKTAIDLIKEDRTSRTDER